MPPKPRPPDDGPGSGPDSGTIGSTGTSASKGTVAQQRKRAAARRAQQLQKKQHAAIKSPTAKRSPSILVTDARKNQSKQPAPFANHRLRQIHQVQHVDKHAHPPQGGTSIGRGGGGGGGGSSSTLNRRQTRRRRSSSKYSDITVSNLTSNISDIPSSTRREPTTYLGGTGRRRMMPQYMRSLPSRSSKSMERLVLIPDESPSLTESKENSEATTENIFTNEAYQRTRAENMTKEQREQEYPRVTAYLIADGFNLKLASQFLAKYHMVSPRLYDDMLYVPYSLPLLPGDDGYRVKSNNSAKNEHGNELMETYIDRTEQRDHHYEFYSGEDVENHVVPTAKEQTLSSSHQSSDFDPSEPQFFTRSSPTDSLIDEEGVASPDSSSRSSGNGSEHHSYHDPFGPGFNRQLMEKYHEDAVDDRTDGHPSSPSARRRSSSKRRKSELPDLTRHAEMFILNYGVVVFWNFSEVHEKNILADLVFAKIQPGEFEDDDDDEEDDEEEDDEEDDDVAVEGDDDDDDDDEEADDDDGDDDVPLTLTIKPLPEQDIETEDFHFEYNKDVPTPRIYNDMITLKSGDHLIKVTISHAIAQSTKLSSFESRMSTILNSISRLPKTLALTGRLQHYTGKKLLMKTGRLLQLRGEVNLSSSVLDTPEFFWSYEPGLHPLYVAIREYLEIDQRVAVLNDRCKVFLDFFDIVSDSLAKGKMARITKFLIIAIGLSLMVSMIEIIIRYLLIKRLRNFPIY